MSTLALTGEFHVLYFHFYRGSLVCGPPELYLRLKRLGGIRGRITKLVFQQWLGERPDSGLEEGCSAPPLVMLTIHIETESGAVGSYSNDSLKPCSSVFLSGLLRSTLGLHDLCP